MGGEKSGLGMRLDPGLSCKVRVLYGLTHCRGVGCIFFEMACGRPMFPGSSVEEELMLMWKVREQTHCNSVAS